MDIKLQNTLTGTKDSFSPLIEGKVSMYHCGPTVYGRQHIGNLSMFVFTDVLRRTFEYFNYDVKQIINITDFGHLVSDGDEGEDKMTKGLKAEGLELSMQNMKLLAEKYADLFKNDLKLLNIKEPSSFPYASEYIEEQKKLIERLEEKDFAYRTSDGVYFDTEKFPNYGKLGNINTGDESRLSPNSEKKNPKDFALWKFSKVPHVRHGEPDALMSDMGKQLLGWDSKWGQGFPGWHIECTAMIFALLGEQIDIHTGGIEHVGVHHNNEIAQAEAASDKTPFSKFWLHREHIRMNDEKIAKSTGNVIYLDDLTKQGIHPLSYRYWLLTSRYNTPSNFTLEAVNAAQVALEKIVTGFALELSPVVGESRDTVRIEVLQKFEAAITNDLNTPIAVSTLQEVNSRETVEKIDSVLGLNIVELAKQVRNIPSNILELQRERDEAREKQDWKLSDDLRDKIEHAGFIVKDSSGKTLILRSLSSLALDLTKSL